MKQKYNCSALYIAYYQQRVNKNVMLTQMFLVLMKFIRKTLPK